MSELDTDYVAIKRWLARGLRKVLDHLEPPRAEITIRKVSTRSTPPSSAKESE